MYLAPVFHILEKCLKTLNILISILSFVDDGLIVVQSKTLTISNSFLFCSYNIAYFLLEKFCLIMEHKKTEVFYFYRCYEVFNCQILDAFCTLPSFGIEVITGFIPIHLYLYKLSRRVQLRAHSLSHNHILQLLLKSRLSLYNDPHHLLLDFLSPYQQEMIKGPIIDIDNRFNEVFPAFDILNKNFSTGSYIIDILPSCFSFHSSNKQSINSLIFQLHQLDEVVIVSSLDPFYALIITDASIKNNVTTSIAYIHVCNKPIIKTTHHAMNVMTTEAKLFAIRCGINQATNIPNIAQIIVITDLLYAMQRIFDSSSYLFQVHSAYISNELRRFFLQNSNNSIEFWECPSHCNWSLHKAVNRESKLFYLIPLHSCKLS